MTQGGMGLLLPHIPPPICLLGSKQYVPLHLGSTPRCTQVPEGLAMGDHSPALHCWAGATSRVARPPKKEQGCPGASQPPFPLPAGPPCHQKLIHRNLCCALVLGAWRWRGLARARCRVGCRRSGLAGRAQHCQGFLPSIVLLSLQPKPICKEEVESLKHRREALSKKASSVLLRRCNHVKKQKGIATCKRAGANSASLRTPTHTASPLRDGHGAHSLGPHTLWHPWSWLDPPQLTEWLRLVPTHPPTPQHHTSPLGPLAAQSHRCSL